jgi:hypothetical protein
MARQKSDETNTGHVDLGGLGGPFSFSQGWAATLDIPIRRTGAEAEATKTRSCVAEQPR